MRPYLSLLWTTRKGTSFKGSFPALGFCRLQSRVGGPGVWSLWKHNWAWIQRAWMAAQPQRMLSVSTLKPLLWGGHRAVPTAFPVPSAQGPRDGTSWLRATGTEAGIIPSWRMAPPRTRGQRNGGGWALWCSPGNARSDCRGVSLSLGCREAAGLASETDLVNVT